MTWLCEKYLQAACLGFHTLVSVVQIASVVGKEKSLGSFVSNEWQQDVVANSALVKGEA
jgi:hypothetical protein